MILEAYEKTSDRITGYKIYDCGTQVATLEFRDQTQLVNRLNTKASYSPDKSFYG